MTVFNLFRFSMGIALSCVMISGHAQIPDTLWRVRVMDLNHKIKVEGTIRFTKESETQSCMVGNWKRAVVDARTINDDTFFPLTEPLAYEIEKGEITLGRTRICDGYLFLTGKVNNKEIRGTYHAPGPGYNRELGYFWLTKIR